MAVPSSRLQFHIASDGLSAFLSVAAGPAAQSAELTEALESNGITTGVLAATLALISDQLLDPNFSCADELLAVGSPAQSGKDAWLELGFAVGLQAGHQRDDGSVDYHDRELLKPIRQGEILGVVHPAQDAIPGQRVDGAVIAGTPARPLTLELRSGVELGTDLVVRATRDGVALYQAGKYLDVVDHHVHQGAVDLHSGDLHMRGSLVIHGDVMKAFSVSATGDIAIQGNVECGAVRAGGHLRVRAGVRGGEGGSVCADGDMTMHHAERADIHVGGELHLHESVNSHLTAVQIHASGRVRGGVASAEQRLVLQEAGTPNGVDTRLTAGEPMEAPLVQAQRSIAVAKSTRLSERARGRPVGRDKGGKTGRARAELDAAEVQWLAERAKRRERLLESASIQIALAHPGVSIRIGEGHVVLDATTQAARYSFDPATVTLRVEKTAR